MFANLQVLLLLLFSRLYNSSRWELKDGLHVVKVQAQLKPHVNE